VASSQPGNGASFVVTLPLPHGQLPLAEAPEKVSVSGGRLLVVDDSPTHCEIVMKQLGSHGFVVDAAASGMAALAMARMAHEEHSPYVLYLVDLQMPEISGSDVIRALRTLPGHDRGPVHRLQRWGHGLAETGERQRPAWMIICPSPIPATSCRWCWLAGCRRQRRLRSPRFASPPPGPAIDAGAFDKIRALSPAGGDDLVCQVVDAYLKAAGREWARFDQALAKGDADVLASAAHALKSGSFNVGVGRFAGLCSEIEQLCRDG
jgi:CheY-like chemotaxis protein/HPt (histidine-containing phosphotransfer) domain-containing protein